MTSHCPDFLVAFDCSSTAIGYAYFHKRQLQDCGSVRSSLPTVTGRIDSLIAQVESVFESLGPSIAAVMEWSEGRPMAFLKDKGRSAQSSVPLAHAQGAFYWWLKGAGVRQIVPIGESKWTKRRGKFVSKPDRATEVMFRYPEFHATWLEDAKSDRWDAADAVGIGDWYISQCLIKDACSEGVSLQTKVPKGEGAR